VSRHHETKIAVVQNLAMKNSVAQTPVNLKAIRTALIVGGYTEIEILTAVRSLARERILRLLPDQQLARISRN
jgi:hypothetical protein